MLAIRICGANYTVSKEAVDVVVGLIPIELLARERVEMRKKKKTKSEIRAETMAKYLGQHK